MAELPLPPTQVVLSAVFVDNRHSTDSEVARYTRNADQARRADLAMDHLSNPVLANQGADVGNAG